MTIPGRIVKPRAYRRHLLFEDTLRKLDTAINAANQSGVDRNELIDIL